MDTRSFTLLETLFAIVLLVAVAALAYPSLMNTLDEQAFESAADMTNEQLMLARAHAQATGAPVEVTYSSEKSQVQVRAFGEWPFPAMRDASPVAATGAGFPFRAGSDLDSAPEASIIAEPWACRPLGPGLKLVSKPPITAVAISSVYTSGPSAQEELESLADGGEDIRLAVFMPDGSALMGDPVWLNDDAGRLGVLTVSAWTGMPLFQRLADLTSSVSEADGVFTESSDTNAATGSRGTGASHSSDTEPRGSAARPTGSRPTNTRPTGPNPSSFHLTSPVPAGPTPPRPR